MIENHSPLDEDLTPRFRWRWHEHGIYLGVSGIIALFVLGLHLMPRAPQRPAGPHIVEVIQVRYLASADEPPEPYDPLRDTRLLRPAHRTSGGATRLGR